MAWSMQLSEVPWSFVMAFASLALIYFLYHRRADVFEDFAFSGKEVALLALGSIAGWAVNIPLALIGGTYLAVNVGGTLVPLILIGWWVRKRKLRIWSTLVGTAIVAAVAYQIVEFHPEYGIAARYPYFFLPVAAALLFALAVSWRRPVTGVPVAYASGTLGALIGADLLNMPHIRAHYAGATENTIISIGGAGVFDMVFLAGAFAMALHLTIIIGLGAGRRGREPREVAAHYPNAPFTLRDSRRVAESFRSVTQPNALETALGALALSDLALINGDFARSVALSRQAVDSVIDAQAPDAAARCSPLLHADAARLRHVHEASLVRGAGLREAGEANMAAKVIVAALTPLTGLGHQLEGVG